MNKQNRIKYLKDALARNQREWNQALEDGESDAYFKDLERDCDNLSAELASLEKSR